MDKSENFTPYRPSSGSEGHCFMEEHCFRCIHDDGTSPFDSPDSCQILACALIYNLDEEGYPRDSWVYFNGRPTCLAFRDRDAGEQASEPDPDQLDLFDVEVEHA